MKRIFTLTAILAALTIGSAQADDIKEAYVKDCQKCHGADGKGDTKMGKKLGAKDYTDPKVQKEMTDEKAFKAIKEGLKEGDKTLMKPAEGLNDDQIKALVKMMRSFEKK